MATARKTASSKGDARVRSDDLSSSPSRASRAIEDTSREDDGTGLSRSERLQQLRNEFAQEALPQVPNIPGWHMCWLTTTSTYDTIAKRERMGYEPVKTEELRGFKVDRMGTASDGLVRVNEMVLYKCPQDVYNMIMQEFHHDQPQREEEALRAQIKQGAGTSRDSAGRELEQVEGFEDLGIARQAPAHFA